MTIQNCYPLCGSRGCSVPDKNDSCANCKEAPNIFDESSYSLHKCTCQPTYFLVNGLCLVIDSKKCGEYCKDCVKVKDNSKCVGCSQSPGIVKGVPDSLGIAECKYIPYDVDFHLKDPSMDRCKGIELIADITPKVILNFFIFKLYKIEFLIKINSLSIFFIY